MTRTEFQELFVKATTDVITFTREYVWNLIPDRVQYRVHPNMSYDKTPDGRILTDYPEDSKIVDGYRIFSEPGEVVDYLWREARVPQWIDVRIQEVTDEFTTIELMCCGRYTADEQLMYYSHWGMGPFGVKGPALPPGWKPDQPNEKFDLHWLRNLRAGGA